MEIDVLLYRLQHHLGFSCCPPRVEDLLTGDAPQAGRNAGDGRQREIAHCGCALAHSRVERVDSGASARQPRIARERSRGRAGWLRAAGHEPTDVGPVDLGRIEDVDQTTVVHHAHAVGQAEDLVQLGGDEQDGSAAVTGADDL